MKTISKISNLSVVCALCAFMASPANSATPVRSLGGSGTYTSASGAAASKASGTSSTRAGSMRLTPSATTRVVGSATSTTGSAKNTSGSTVASPTRVGSSPRLSIGKYLSNKATVSGGSSSGGVSGGVDGEFADKIVIVEGDVKELETALNLLDERVGVLESLDNVTVEELDSALNALDERVGLLEGVEVVTADELALVQAAVDAVESAVEALPESMSKTEIETLVSEMLTTSGVVTQEGLSGLKASLDSMAAQMNKMAEDAAAVSAIVTGLQTAVDGLGSRLTAAEGAVEGLGTRLTAAEGSIGELSGAMTKYIERPAGSGVYMLQVDGENHQWLSIEFVDGVDNGDVVVEPSEPVQAE